MTFVIGLSGGIGSGKSTVDAMLEKLGAVLIDADSIVHEVQAPGSPVLSEIAAAFGSGVIDADGALDRAALGDVIFRDPEARELPPMLRAGGVVEVELRWDAETGVGQLLCRGD